MDDKSRTTTSQSPLNSELEHLDKHEEVSGQFTYDHLQVNELPAATEVANPTPVVPSPQFVQPSAIPQSIDTKIGLLRNWAIIIAVYAFSFTVGQLSDEVYKIIAPFLLSFYIFLLSSVVRRLNAKTDDTLTEKDRTLVVLSMALGTPISQIVYYFNFRKKKPLIGRVTKSIGWKVFFIWVAYVVIFGSVTVLQSWEFRHSDEFNAKLAIVKQDAQAMSAAASGEDIAQVRAKCEAMAAHTKELQQLPAYPDEKIQNDIKSGEDKIINGSGNCVRGIDNEDSNLIKSSAQEMRAGATQLGSAIKTANDK